MKKLFLMMIMAAANTLLAQDIFQQKFYSPELALKYRQEIGLSTDQVEKIKNIYNSEIPAYNNKKWDLDAEMTALEKVISQNKVDAKAAAAQLSKSLALETEIKKLKLDMLVKIKNILTPAQQARLDTHKNESVDAGSIIASLNNDQNLKVRINSGVDPSKKPLIKVIEGTQERIITMDGSTSGIEGVNPDDIESMTVLKAETAVQLYGKQAENGMIIITLKKKLTTK